MLLKLSKNFLPSSRVCSSNSTFCAKTFINTSSFKRCLSTANEAPLNSDPTDPNVKTTHFGFKTVPEEQKVHLVGSVFTNVSSKYDIMNDLMSAGLYRRFPTCLLIIRNSSVEIKDIPCKYLS